MKNLNPYQISWVALIPVKGNATKRDYNKLTKFGFGKIGGIFRNSFVDHFASKEKAQEFISKINGLNKAYKAVILTDKQFGMIKGNADIESVLTTMQKESAIIIK